MRPGRYLGVFQQMLDGRLDAGPDLFDVTRTHLGKGNRQIDGARQQILAAGIQDEDIRDSVDRVGIDIVVDALVAETGMTVAGGIQEFDVVEQQQGQLGLSDFAIDAGDFGFQSSNFSQLMLDFILDLRLGALFAFNLVVQGLNMFLFLVVPGGLRHGYSHSFKKNYIWGSHQRIVEYNNIIDDFWQENTPHGAGLKVALIVVGFVPFEVILADIINDEKRDEDRRKDDNDNEEQAEQYEIFECIHAIPSLITIFAVHFVAD